MGPMDIYRSSRVNFAAPPATESPHTSFQTPSLISILISRSSSMLLRPAWRMAVVAMVFLRVGRPLASRSLGLSWPALTCLQPSTNFSSEM
ncbi:hypothetical protein CH063_13970 [Colletotrichum higginsianum]|uniref:Uncharacterized protein n=1 Tax=Colletotrichum higginsianum (strain IMI 349063) TaxID=759273 RepID=H1VWM0_COLHI|nr:hypothetical protein CH063_13970 [Colletotrichum higginsianum]